MGAEAPGPRLQAMIDGAPWAPILASTDDQHRAALMDLDVMQAAQRQIAHHEAIICERLARLARRYPGVRDFYEFEIALALGVSEATADARVRDAERLATVMTATLAVMRDGQLSFGKGRALVRATANVGPEVARAVEAIVLPEAAGLTEPEIRHRCEELIVELDAAGAAERHQRAKKTRTVKRWSEADGMGSLHVFSTAQDIATIWEAITALADNARGGAEDDRPLDARRVDVLVDMCADVLAAGEWRGRRLTERQGRRPHVQVLMPFAALLGGDSACELVGHGPISAAQARDIAADATLSRLVCDPLSGQLLDYGETRYEPSPHLKRFVMARDQRCIAPGCRVPATRCQIDHRVPFRLGDATGADNLGSPCQHHHVAKDGGGFDLRKDENGDYVWTTPLGRTYRRRATRLLRPAQEQVIYNGIPDGRAGQNTPDSTSARCDDCDEVVQLVGEPIESTMVGAKNDPPF